jgi:hypothetical protein
MYGDGPMVMTHIAFWGIMMTTLVSDDVIVQSGWDENLTMESVHDKLSNCKVLIHLLLKKHHNVKIPKKEVPKRMNSPMIILMRTIIKNKTQSS